MAKMVDRISAERLKEMTETIKVYAENPIGISVNEINSKDIYRAFLELQERRDTAEITNGLLKRGFISGQTW